MASFAPDFKFGSATSAYQIEGAWNTDGKGQSIWDDFVHRGGNVMHGETGDVSSDHYNRFREDVALMAKLGLQTYRLSISWPRIQPKGSGEVNEAGIAFYNALIDELLKHNIEPLLTLYHWDLPLALEQEFGGFQSRKLIPAFVQYAKLCFERFGDRVKSWLTFNEPWCICVHGYCTGMHAPGRTSKAGTEPYKAAHHLLLAHAEAVQLYRTEFQASQGGRIGITLNTEFWEPASDDPRDVAVAEQALEFNLGWFADPVFLTGDYPESMKKAVGSRLPRFTPEESAMLKGSSDFFGLNHYSTHVVGRMNACVALSELPKQISLLYKSSASMSRFFKSLLTFLGNNYLKDIGALTYPDPSEWTYTDMYWGIVPWGIRKLLLYIQKRYSPAGGIVITENGCAIREPRAETALDPRSSCAIKRTQFLHDYLSEVAKAVEEGADVRAYFCWSFCDNFEWAFGYSKRFGLVRVEYDTLKRSPRPAAYWYSQLARTKQLAPVSELEAITTAGRAEAGEVVAEAKPAEASKPAEP